MSSENNRKPQALEVATESELPLRRSIMACGNCPGPSMDISCISISIIALPSRDLWAFSTCEDALIRRGCKDATPCHGSLNF